MVKEKYLSKIKYCEETYIKGFDGMFYRQKQSSKSERPVEVHFKFTDKYRIYLNVLYVSFSDWGYTGYIEKLRVTVFDNNNEISLENKPIFKKNIKYIVNDINVIKEIKEYL